MLTIAKRLLCLLIGHEHGPDCTRCLTFVCAECRRRVSWDCGAADDEPELCDDCWLKNYRQSSPAPT